MLRRKVLSLATALVSLATSGLAVAQDATTPPPAPPPAAEPAAPAPAAEPAAAKAPEKEKTEEITITGSRIRRKDLNTPAPVTIISRDQVLQSGKVTIADFLQAMPEQGNALNFQVNNGNTDAGVTAIDIRSLGAQRTLVLLNGRRMVNGGQAGALGGTSSVDLGTIPAAAVERIEVLKDGASAIYGSDAIGGVVNVITRKRYNQAEISAMTGISSRGDGNIYDISLTTGSSGERSNVLFSAGYSEQVLLGAGDRPWSQKALGWDYTANGGAGEEYANGSPTLPTPSFDVPTALRGQTPAGSTALWNSLMAACTETDRTRCPGAYIYDPNADGAYAGLNWRPKTGADLYNFQPDNHLVQPNKHYSLFAVGDYSFSDNVRAFFEASFVNRRSEAALAAMPVTTGGFGATFSRDSYYNPFGVDLTRVRRRTNEFDLRRYQHDADAFRIAAGFDGTLPEVLGPLAGWAWDTSINVGRSTLVRTETGQLQPSRLAPLISASMLDPATNEVVCVGTPGDLTTRIDGCTPLNLLAPPGALDPAQGAGVVYTGTSKAVNDLVGFAANASGDVIQLLGERPIALAVGYEYREHEGSSVPDPLTASGDTTGNATQPVKGRYNVHEAYAELSIPIVANLPGAEDVELTAALRYSDYTTYGGNTTYKVGGRWRPIRDFTARGTYSTAFRAPSVGELYSGLADNFPNATDPCGDLTGLPDTDPVVVNCMAEGIPRNGNGTNESQIRTVQGGNTALEAETADIFTLGAVFEPSFLKNFSLTVDYYNIKIDDSIQPIGANTILAGCYGKAGDARQFCPNVFRDTDGFIDHLFDPNINVGGTRAQGLDFSARYLMPSGFGRFNFALDMTYVIKNDAILGDGTAVKGAGNYDSSILGLNPKWKGNLGVTWGLKNFGAGVSTKYWSAVDECGNSVGDSDGGSCTFNPQFKRDVGSYNTWDAFASYEMPWAYGKTSLNVGVQNAFDEAPPKVYDTITQFSYFDYDFIGRYYYFRLLHKY